MYNVWFITTQFTMCKLKYNTGLHKEMATIKDIWGFSCCCCFVWNHLQQWLQKSRPCLMSLAFLCQGTIETGTLADTERPSAATHLCFKLITWTKRSLKVKEPPDPSKPTLCCLLTAHHLLCPQVPVPLCLHHLSKQRPAVSCMQVYWLQHNHLALGWETLSVPSPPWCLLTQSPFPYWLWLKFHHLGFGFHCVL